MDEQVYRWIADYCEGSIKKEDFEQLKTWLEEKPEHKRFFEENLKLHRRGQEIGFIGHVNTYVSWSRLERRLQRRKNMGIKRWIAAAAIIILGLFGGNLLWLEETEQESDGFISAIPGNTSVKLRMADGKEILLSHKDTMVITEKDGTRVRKDSTGSLRYHTSNVADKSVEHTLDVPIGGEFDLTLADGTRVWLNSETQLRFPTHFTGKTREVYVSGEAYFIVKKDTIHPFVVHANGAQVKVLGTAFNLSAYEKERITTTLQTGCVEMSIGTKLVKLSPGEQATWNDMADSIDVKKVDVSIYSSWVKGMFEFENVSLYDITRQLSRWYGVTFRFEEKGSANRRFTGGIKKYIPLHQSLEIIEKTTNVFFEIDGDEITIKSRSKE